MKQAAALVHHVLKADASRLGISRSVDKLSRSSSIVSGDARVTSHPYLILNVALCRYRRKRKLNKSTNTRTLRPFVATATDCQQAWHAKPTDHASLGLQNFLDAPPYFRTSATPMRSQAKSSTTIRHRAPLINRCWGTNSAFLMMKLVLTTVARRTS